MSIRTTTAPARHSHQPTQKVVVIKVCHETFCHSERAESASRNLLFACSGTLRASPARAVVMLSEVGLSEGQSHAVEASLPATGGHWSCAISIAIRWTPHGANVRSTRS